LPVVVDINVLVDAVVAEPDPSGWKTPPPVRGDPAAMALAALNQGMEFGLWLSPHTLAGTKRVLTGAYGFEQTEADRCERVLVDIALRTGGIITPDVSVHDSRDWEDSRIHELAEAAGALLIISSDADLLEVPHGGGFQ
jgi:predicted nucleic acid-binding protein